MVRYDLARVGVAGSTLPFMSIMPARPRIRRQLLPDLRRLFLGRRRTSGRCNGGMRFEFLFGYGLPCRLSWLRCRKTTFIPYLCAAKRRFRVPGRTLLRTLSLTFQVVLFYHNGSGKSTLLLKMLGRHQPPSEDVFCSTISRWRAGATGVARKVALSASTIAAGGRNDGANWWRLAAIVARRAGTLWRRGPGKSRRGDYAGRQNRWRIVAVDEAFPAASASARGLPCWSRRTGGICCWMSRHVSAGYRPSG